MKGLFENSIFGLWARLNLNTLIKYMCLLIGYPGNI